MNIVSQHALTDTARGMGSGERHTLHTLNGVVLDSPHFLEIHRSVEAGGFYLYYLDRNREIQTDTFHDTLTGAKEQAEFEFGIPPSSWIDVFPER